MGLPLTGSAPDLIRQCRLHEGLSVPFILIGFFVWYGLNPVRVVDNVGYGLYLVGGFNWFLKVDNISPCISM
jgi:hypothetical protein